MTSQSSLSWTVVVFEATKTEKESVQAVPSNWINGDQCVWPSLPPEKLNIAMKKCQFNSCWPSFKVRILRNATYGDYTVARKKAKRAESTSDLNTDDSEAVGKRRKYRPNRIDDAESDDSDEPLSKRKQISNRQIPDPPLLGMLSESEDMILNNLEDEDMHTPQTTNKPSCSGIATQDMHTPQTTNKPSGSGIATQDMHTPQTTNKPIGSGIVTEKTKCHQCLCRECKKQFFYFKQMLMEILVKVNNIITNQPEQRETERNCAEIFDLADFPLKSRNELNNFENHLLEKKTYSLLVAYFCKAGGCTVAEYVRRCLGPLLSNQLAEEFSFHGRKNKDRFKDLNVTKALLDAASKTRKNDLKEVEQAVACWLKRARERERRQQAQNRNLELTL